MNEHSGVLLRLTLIGIVATGIALAVSGLASAGPDATTPPYGSDLPFKAYGPLLAGDNAGPPATPTISASPTPTSANVTPLSCGEERWAIKTLSDPAAASVNPTPVDTTV